MKRTHHFIIAVVLVAIAGLLLGRELAHFVLPVHLTAAAAGDNDDEAARKRAACRFYKFAQDAGMNAVITIDGEPVQCDKNNTGEKK